MRRLATVWFWLVLAITFPLGWAIGMVMLPFTIPFDRHRHVVHHFLCWWCFQYLRAFPTWRVKRIDMQKLPKGPCVIIANHQSLADIWALMGLPIAFKFVAKKALFSVPLLGFAMRRLQYVEIDRGSVTSTQDMLAKCEKLLDEGQPVLIFPEGTYATGPNRLPFKRGAFALAKKKNVPLVPVLLEGTSDLVFEDGPLFAAKSDVRITVKDPILPPQDLDDAQWAKQLELAYKAWLTRSPAN